MTNTATQSNAVTFFREHAGFSYDPKTETADEGHERCARDLARAEEAFRADDETFIVWEVDDIDSSFFEETDEPHALFCALLCRDVEQVGCSWPSADIVRGYDPRDGMFERGGKIVAVLGGINFGADGYPSSDPYARVVAAEMYAEFEVTRENMIERGEN